MERVRWWFNGRWGHLARRDMIIWTRDGRYAIEARYGGTEGRSRWLKCADLGQAEDVANNLMEDSDGWRELSI
jgi:hypothetical protein